MIYAEPLYDIERVDEAAKALLSPPIWTAEYQADMDVINNWRRSHSFPQNTFWVTLNKYAKELHPDSVVAQRTNRLKSIKLKLQRFDWLTLSAMQDLGGCRAIMRSVEDVDALVKRYKTSSRIKHKLIDEDDYIRNPKPTGYRGIHLIYAYNSDKKATYNGLKIELQIRSSNMHAWATAVETVDTFNSQNIKTGKGPTDWRRFFKLMATHFAVQEGAPVVPKTSSNHVEVIAEIRDLAMKLDVINRLTAYGRALEAYRSPDAPIDAHYFVLSLDPDAHLVTIWSYEKEFVQQAETKTQELEAAGNDAVLVSVESIEALHKAYPNYFLDARAFLDAVNEVLR